MNTDLEHVKIRCIPSFTTPPSIPLSPLGYGAICLVTHCIHAPTNFRDIENCRQPKERNKSHALKGINTFYNSSILTKKAIGSWTFKMSSWWANNSCFTHGKFICWSWNKNIFYLLDISSKSLLNTLKLRVHPKSNWKMWIKREWLQLGGYFFWNFSRRPLLIWLHCCFHHYKTLKAVATATAAIVLLTPANFYHFHRQNFNFQLLCSRNSRNSNP